jgi:hypothetical protein
MRGRGTLTGAASARVPVVLRPRPRRAFLGLLLLVLGAGSALAQTTTGYPPVDFGTSPIGTGVTRTVLTLTAAAVRVIDSVTLTGASSGDFAVAAGSCAAGSTLTAGSSCTVSVTLTPAAGGCRQALLRVASHDMVTNATFLDVAALIGAGIGPAPPDTVPLVLPFTVRSQGTPVITPITGTPESTFTINPTVLATRGGLNQLSVQGTLITANAGAPPRTVTISTLRFVGQRFHLIGEDTLVLCAVGSVVPGPGGPPVVEDIFYVASGTGHFAGATGSGRMVATAGPGGVLVSDRTGTLTLRIPTGPFAYIYLTDLLRLY